MCPMGGERRVCTAFEAKEKEVPPHRKAPEVRSCECTGATILRAMAGPLGEVAQWHTLEVNPRHRAFQPWQRIYDQKHRGKGGGLDFRDQAHFGQGVFIIGGAQAASLTLCLSK